METCPRCGSQRPAARVECPRCGVIYAKAEARAAALPHAAAAPEYGPASTEAPDFEGGAALEASIRTWAIPSALVCAFLLVSTGPGRAVVRVFFGMWIHELGHASAAWLCGFVAMPGPWRTLTASARSPAFAALISAALIYAVVRSWLTGRKRAALSAAALLLLQLCCTLLLSARFATAFVVFAGDAGCLVIGSLLMASMYAPLEGAIRRGHLRWGFLAIGAGAFADAFEQWLRARADPDRIPFGMNEGVGPSDPSVLSDEYGWSASLLVHRYVALGCVCLVALGCIYVLGRRKARGDALRQRR
ncbi:MAG: hypothetical protein ACJ79H_08250 [Myxococcales bacterium]